LLFVLIVFCFDVFVFKCVDKNTKKKYTFNLLKSGAIILYMVQSFSVIQKCSIVRISFSYALMFQQFVAFDKNATTRPDKMTTVRNILK